MHEIYIYTQKLRIDKLTHPEVQGAADRPVVGKLHAVRHLVVPPPQLVRFAWGCRSMGVWLVGWVGSKEFGPGRVA